MIRPAVPRFVADTGVLLRAGTYKRLGGSREDDLRVNTDRQSEGQALAWSGGLLAASSLLRLRGAGDCRVRCGAFRGGHRCKARAVHLHGCRVHTGAGTRCVALLAADRRAGRTIPLPRWTHTRPHPARRRDRRRRILAWRQRRPSPDRGRPGPGDERRLDAVVPTARAAATRVSGRHVLLTRLAPRGGCARGGCSRVRHVWRVGAGPIGGRPKHHRGHRRMGVSS